MYIEIVIQALKRPENAKSSAYKRRSNTKYQ